MDLDDFYAGVEEASEWQNEIEQAEAESDGEPLPSLEGSDDEDNDGTTLGEIEYRGPHNSSPAYKKSCSPDVQLFNEEPPFVKAVFKKGKPKCGNTVMGYCFRSGLSGVGYYRDSLEYRAQRTIDKPRRRTSMPASLYPSLKRSALPPIRTLVAIQPSRSSRAQAGPIVTG